MIKAFSAVTREIDDARAAVAEILSALDIKNNLMKNSLGIISCFSDCDDTGIIKAVCDALPFDCIGATSCLSSAAGEVDQILFAITVLTSDDCDFKTVSIDIDDNYKDRITTSLGGFFGEDADKPKMLLGYFPLIGMIGGDVMLDEINKASGGVPLFGTICIDHNPDFSTSKTIYNGDAGRTKLVLCAIYGNPKFSFEIASLDETKIRKQKAVITESSGNVLIGVNGKPVLEYLDSIGLTRLELDKGLVVLPLVIEQKDSPMPVARAVIALTGQGHAICGGSMPEGATLAIGRIDMEDVLRTTEKVMGKLSEGGGIILSYSCMSRYLVLGVNIFAEAEKVINISNGSPYIFACSAGEFCPLTDESGKLVNYFHNYTTVFCKIS